MRSAKISLLCHATNACAAAAVLASLGGCSTPELSHAPVGTVHDSAGTLRSAGLGGELLTGSKVKLRAGKCNGLSGGSVRFTASGTATGPYPGTFTAKGDWSFAPLEHPVSYYFHERFTITSGTISFSGHSGRSWQEVGAPAPGMTCGSFGPVTSDNRLKYHAGLHGSGSVTGDGVSQGELDETLN